MFFSHKPSDKLFLYTYFAAYSYFLAVIHVVASQQKYPDNQFSLSGTIFPFTQVLSHCNIPLNL